MRSYRALLALAVLAVLAGQANGDPRLTEHSLLHDGHRRAYLVYTPEDADRFDGKRPLVFVLHGGGGTHTGMPGLTKRRFHDLADRDGFFVVYPNAVGKIWDFGEGFVSEQLKTRVDDEGFFRRLLEHLPREYPIDPARIFATGISRGGQASYFLACRFPGVFRAIAPVTMPLPAFLRDDCQEGPPVGVAVFNGTADRLVPYGGGQISLLGRKRGRILSTDETMALWRRRNGCSDEVETQVLPDRDGGSTAVERFDWRRCTGAPVRLYRIEGGGHTWPSGGQYLPRALVGKVTGDIDGAREIWSFFSAFGSSDDGDGPGIAGPAKTYDPARPGPLETVRTEMPDLVDPAREGRLIATRVTAPAGSGPFPLVILSHGLGGRSSSHQSIANHLASHGYLVLAPNHPASDTKRVFEGRTDYASGPHPGLDPAAVLGRPLDISFLIDKATDWNDDPSHPLAGKLDLSKIAVAGHSFGAYTVLAACGARPILDHLDPPVAPGRGLAPSMRDSRIDAGIAYSPNGPNSGFFDEESYSAVDCPLLSFSGSRDRQLNGVGDKKSLPPRNRYRSFELSPAGDKYYIWLWGAGHMGWADFSENSALVQTAARLTTPENDDVLYLSRAMSVVFLDAYLRDDARARALLNEEYAQSLTGEVVRKIRWDEK